MQLVEIAEAVSRKADLIIMDEPTSALTEKEVAHLFTIIKGLKERGVAVIYITHKMDEVFAITDEVSVYRDGEFVGHEESADLTREKLIKMMVGRTIDQFFQKENAAVRQPRPRGGRPHAPGVFPGHQLLRPGGRDPRRRRPDRRRPDRGHGGALRRHPEAGAAR